MACSAPEGVLAQETRFFDMMAGVESFTVKGHELTLATGGGDALVFEIGGIAPPPRPGSGGADAGRDRQRRQRGPWFERRGRGTRPSASTTKTLVRAARIPAPRTPHRAPARWLGLPGY